MEPEASEPEAPPVVAVVVTCDPGPWFEESLAALAAQDYPNLSVLIVDASMHEDPSARVADILPGAFVRRLARNPGFGAAANEALKLVEGASHLLFCHDDVAPDPAAVSLMVQEAYRSNAGVVTPKLVIWDAPEHLLAVGMGADKTGAMASRVERGELDQEQHDAVRDVFVAPGAFMLVRADLFSAIDGFDPEITMLGEDLDLSWRAQVAGARVVVAPAARVRHLEATNSSQRSPRNVPTGSRGPLHQTTEALERRHQLRCVLKNYNRWHRFRVLSQLLVLNVAEVMVAVANRRWPTARAVIGAWRWNLSRSAALRKARHQVHTYRLLSDHDVRELQIKGLVRLNFLLQPARRVTHLHAGGRGSTPRRSGADRVMAGVVVVAALVYLFGTRDLLGGHLPRVGQLARFPGASNFISAFANTWRSTGLGGAAPAPTAFGLLGVAGFVLLGGTHLLQWALVVGAVPVGLYGVYRLGARTGSARAGWVAMVAYGAAPLAYNAFAEARWDVLVAFGAMPWVLAGTIRLAATNREGRLRLFDLLAGGLVLAVVGALVPAVAVAAGVSALGLAAGSLLAGRAGLAWRTLLSGLGCVAVAIVLNLPWALDLLRPGSHWSGVVGIGADPAHAYGFGSLLRFATGSLGHGMVGWALLVPAILPLVVGRGWRFEWAARLWTLAVFSWAFAWAGGRGWLGPAFPPGVFLVPAALAVALSAALGARAFEIDLRGYRFGWRQAATALAAAALAVAVLPVLADSVGGRWNTPSGGFDEVLAPMAAPRGSAPERILWIGDPRILPLRGWELGPGQAYAVSLNGFPDARDQWPQSNPGAAGVLAGDLGQAESGLTAQLGHLLARYDVAWVVIPNRLSPGQSRAVASTYNQDPSLLRTLLRQSDLSLVPGDPSVTMLRNVAFHAEARSAVGHSQPVAGYGQATLGYRGSPARYGEVGVELIAWLGVLYWLWRLRSSSPIPTRPPADEARA
ncbi:MAG: glycosyltransferase [Acidimicrobiales bacterium]